MHARHIPFSSYPGLLYSFDDFYSTSIDTNTVTASTSIRPPL